MSSSGLYGYTGNVSVSANNLTTLYNAQPGNVVVANVPDRNFTTLYTKQSDITPTKPYGNANVEAFLNAGTDGGNSVQNIRMSGNIYVGGQSFLGPVSNVHITGGTNGYVLSTNGAGNLSWVAQSGGSGNAVPYIHFDVSSNGNNQQFANTLLSNYANANVMNVFKNGVNIEPTYYEKASTNVLQINIPLATGDTIDVIAQGAGGGGGGGNGTPGGTTGSVQFNTGGSFDGTTDFIYDSNNSTLTSNYFSGDGSKLSNIAAANIVGTVANASHATVSDSANSVAVANVSGIGNIATVNLTGSTSNVLYGNGVFAAISITSVANANYANYAGNAFSVSGSNVSGTVANANYATYSGTAFSVSGSNVSGTVANANYATYSGTAFSVSGSNVSGTVANANYATYSGTAFSVSGSNVSGTVANANYAAYAGNITIATQSNITSVGTLTTLYSTQYVETRTAPTISGSSLTLDLSLCNVFDVNLTASITTLTISNAPTTGRAYGFTLKLNITGSYTITWPASVKWANGTAPTLTTTAGKVDVFEFLTVDGGTTYYGFTAGQNL